LESGSTPRETKRNSQEAEEDDFNFSERLPKATSIEV
jgi:hypothetical protein